MVKTIRNEDKTVHLLRLYRDLCRDLAFDVWNDDTIPVRTTVSAPVAWTSE